MNIIIFNRTIGGHHLEYIHHLYMVATAQKEDKFYFVLPRYFEDVKNNWEWPTSLNVHIDLFGEKDDKIKSDNVWQMLLNSWSNSRLVSYYVKKYRADVVYCNLLIGLIPFAPLFIRSKVRLMGVIYRIFLYDSEGKSKISLMLDKFKYLIMSRAKVFRKIFILNDMDGAEQLNMMFHTNKFAYLPDPYVPISSDNLTDFRKENGITTEKKLFIQFGTLCSNKSTVEILESIKSLTTEEKKRFSFAFAGKVYDEIKDHFYELVNELKGETQIIVIDQYCAYETFASMCVACDAILTPYRRTAQSSGLIGYASQFHKPVIAVDSGLLGNLVKQYELGILIDRVNNDCLANAYRKIAAGGVLPPTSAYCEKNSVEEFQNVIIKSL